MDTKGVNPPADLLEVSDQFVYNTTMYISPSLSIFLAEPILYCLACRTLRSGPVDYVALQPYLRVPPDLTAFHSSFVQSCFLGVFHSSCTCTACTLKLVTALFCLNSHNKSCSGRLTHKYILHCWHKWPLLTGFPFLCQLPTFKV
jgi:hypothetical protein